MIPATRAVGPARTGALPMPWVEELKSLYELGVTFRHGQLIMIGGFPGSMKSVFATWLCNLWNLPTLYVSADMSQHTAITRLGSLRSGYSHDEVSDAFEKSDHHSDYIERELSGSNLQFLFDDAPTLDDIEEELLAWVELYDDLPAVMVIDNLVDLSINDGGEEFKAWNDALLWFKGVCRTYGITIIVLHHARELSKSDFPAPRKDFQGKPGKTPELMMSVALTPDDEFRLAVVKNRTGSQDAMAREGVEYLAIPARMTFQPRGKWTTGD